MSQTSIIVMLSRGYYAASRDGRPVRVFAAPHVYDGYEMELRVRGARQKNNEHEYLYSDAAAAEEGFVNLLFMGIPLCRDPSMTTGVHFEVRGYEPNQVDGSAAPHARRDHRAVGGAGAGTPRPAQPATSDGPRLDGEGAGMKLEKFLIETGRCSPYAIVVGRQVLTHEDGIGLWIDRGDRYLLVKVSNLELLQNRIDSSNVYPRQYPLGCNPRCWDEHIPGYDQLHVGPEMREVFKKGLYGSGEDPNALLPKSASKQLSGIDTRTPPKGEWLDVERGVFNGLPVQEREAQRVLTGFPHLPQVPFGSGAPRKSVVVTELNPKTNELHRKQLRMLVNEKAPLHLLGAEIVKVETSCNQMYIDAFLAGAREPVRIPAQKLWEANLTVPGIVELYGGTCPKAEPVTHPMAP